MNKSTKKNVTGVAIAAVGTLLTLVAWNWFNGEQKVQEAKAKTEAA